MSLIGAAPGCSPSSSPDPLVLPLVVFGVLALVLAIAASLVPETAGVLERPPYRTQRASVPPAGRRGFFAAAAGGVIAFAVFGLFTSLAPSFLAVTLGSHSHALAGATAFLVFAAGALSQSLLARLGTRLLSAIGIVLLLAGLALVTVATWMPDLAAFLAGGLLSVGADRRTRRGDAIRERAGEPARLRWRARRGAGCGGVRAVGLSAAPAEAGAGADGNQLPRSVLMNKPELRREACVT
jgi:hypothetical protein